MGRVTRIGRTAVVALGAAVIWSALVWVAAFTVPVYTGETVSSESTDITTTSDTLIGVNGLGGVVVVSIPLVLSVLVAICLTTVPWPAGRVAGWTLTGLFGAFNLLAMLTIGLFLLPVTLALVIACAASRNPATPSRDHAELVDPAPSA